MKLQTIINISLSFILLLFLTSCQSDGTEGEEASDAVVEEPAPDQPTPAQLQHQQEQRERDPGTVYVDTEYLDFDNRGVATYANYIYARTIKYHQFDVAQGEILDVKVSSDSDQTQVLFLDPEGNRLVREQFGGPDGHFTWDERFNTSGLYTLQIQLMRDFAAEGGSTNYSLELRKSWD